MSHKSMNIHGITKIKAGPVESCEKSQFRLISIYTIDGSGNPETVEIRCFGPEPFEVTVLEEG